MQGADKKNERLNMSFPPATRLQALPPILEKRGTPSVSTCIATVPQPNPLFPRRHCSRGTSVPYARRTPLIIPTELA